MAWYISRAALRSSRRQPLRPTSPPSRVNFRSALRFSVVGRSSCTGVSSLVVDFVRRLRPALAVLVADHDGPGMEGAADCASHLVRSCPVCVITPPTGVKDLREWKQRGARKADIEKLIEDSHVRRLSIESRPVVR